MTKFLFKNFIGVLLNFFLLKSIKLQEISQTLGIAIIKINFFLTFYDLFFLLIFVGSCREVFFLII